MEWFLWRRRSSAVSGRFMVSGIRQRIVGFVISMKSHACIVKKLKHFSPCVNLAWVGGDVRSSERMLGFLENVGACVCAQSDAGKQADGGSSFTSTASINDGPFWIVGI